jgi:hypothetical protein
MRQKNTIKTDECGGQIVLRYQAKAASCARCLQRRHWYEFEDNVCKIRGKRRCQDNNQIPEAEILTCAALHDLLELYWIRAHLTVSGAFAADPLVKAGRMNIPDAAVASARSEQRFRRSITIVNGFSGKIGPDPHAHLNNGISASPGCLQILHSKGGVTSSRGAAVSACIG